jgi:hypothetical protein
VYGSEGIGFELGTVDIDPADQGKDCVTSVTVTNESLWPETNLSLHSGTGYVIAHDVESQKGTYTIPLGHLVLEETVTAYLQFGPGEASSIEGEFSIVCETPDEPPTPPEEPPTVTTPPPAPTAPPAVVVPARFTG